MRLRILLLSCLAFPFLTGWGHWGPQVKVGVALDQVQGRAVLVHSLKNELEDNRADLLLKDAKGDPAAQEQQVKDLIAQGIQALILLPADPQKAAPLVQAAHQAGIKVVCLERIIPNSGADYLVAFNPAKSGEMQAKAMIKIAPQGEYVLLKGPSGDWKWLDYQEGLMKALQPPIAGGSIRILAVDSNPGSTKEAKEPGLERVLKTKDGQIGALLGPDEETTKKMARARDEAGLSRKLPLAGAGEDLETCRRIASGLQSLTLYHPPKKLAAEAAYLTAKVARKATQFDCQFTDLENGAGTTKAVLLTPVVVDAKNLDSTIIQDGVQQREEVYGKQEK